MKVVRVGCTCPDHGAITLPDCEENREDLDSAIEGLRENGCFPLIDSMEIGIDLANGESWTATWRLKNS